MLSNNNILQVKAYPQTGFSNQTCFIEHNEMMSKPWARLQGLHLHSTFLTKTQISERAMTLTPRPIEKIRHQAIKTR